MTVHIDGVRVVIFMIGCLVGYVVYKHQVNAHPGQVQKGDLASAVGAAFIAMMMLTFLFGFDGGGGQGSTEITPAPVATSTSVLIPEVS